MGDMADMCLAYRDPYDEYMDCCHEDSYGWRDPDNHNTNFEPQHYPYLRIVHETEKGILIEIEPNVGVWLPKNYVAFHPSEKTVAIPHWIHKLTKVKV